MQVKMSINAACVLVLYLNFICLVCATAELQVHFHSQQRGRRDADLDNDIETSNVHTSSEGYQASDLIDLADLEALLSRANNNYKVVISRGVPQLKINGSFVDTNEGMRKLFIFISNAKIYSGGEGFSSSSSHESEGLTTTQMEYMGSDGMSKRENRYEVSYWNYKYQQGSDNQDILEKYEVKVMCQPNPPGHTLSVNGQTITSGSAVWHLTIAEACRFWKA
ncbi:uncharacterized protein [Anabrus simplex]|uniref:uncharacterized protein n=1 Tax=Anabrus simplex TaxID=316456 RepID=UPI0035A2E9C8